MPTELTYLYTSEEEIIRLYGSTGQQGITQDLSGSTREAWFTELLSDASDIINQYCLIYYLPVDLADSRWVRTRATWIACYILSQRRANPALFALRYEQIIEELNMVLQGVIQIPGLPTRGDFSPALSNYIVDDTFTVNKIRVHQSISTGGTSSRQDLSYRWSWDWL